MTDLEEITKEYIKKFETEFAFSDVTETDKKARYYFLSKVFKDGYEQALNESCLGCYKDFEERIEELEEENAELKSQNKKMRCCGNCKHFEIEPTKEKVQFCCKCKQLDETKDNIILTKWELDN